MYEVDCVWRKNITSESYCAYEIGSLHYFLVTKTDCYKKPAPPLASSLVLTVANAHSVNRNIKWTTVHFLSLIGGILSSVNKVLKALLRAFL